MYKQGEYGRGVDVVLVECQGGDMGVLWVECQCKNRKYRSGCRLGTASGYIQDG